MAQITIYLDQETADRMRSLVKARGISQSKWIAGLIRRQLRTEWPQEVRALAGAWPDLPEVEKMRAGLGEDAPREAI